MRGASRAATSRSAPFSPSVSQSVGLSFCGFVVALVGAVLESERGFRRRAGRRCVCTFTADVTTCLVRVSQCNDAGAGGPEDIRSPRVPRVAGPAAAGRGAAARRPTTVIDFGIPLHFESG